MTDEKLDTDLLNPWAMLSFASAEQATSARRALDEGDARGRALQCLDSAEMQSRLDDAVQAAGATCLAGPRGESGPGAAPADRTRIPLHRRAVDDEAQARRTADTARAHGAERALHYGHLLIEDLIEIDDTPVQRGVDNPEPGDKRRRSGRA